ncbi:hypothetical protein Aduo_016457 [Ancylostoma duodenale]
MSGTRSDVRRKHSTLGNPDLRKKWTWWTSPKRRATKREKPPSLANSEHLQLSCQDRGTRESPSRPRRR